MFHITSREDFFGPMTMPTAAWPLATGYEHPGYAAWPIATSYEHPGYAAWPLATNHG